MKKKEFLAEISKLGKAELLEKARSVSEEVMKLKIRHASRQLETPHRIGAAKKNLARVLTALNSQKDKK
jgi:ribosomal protein L29